MARRKTAARKATKKSAGAGARKKAAAKKTKTPARKRAARRPGAARATARKPARKPLRKAAAPKVRARKPARPAKPAPKPVRAKKAVPPSRPTAPARLARERRVLEDVVPSPPSSLDLRRDASSARTGRAEIAEHQADHSTMTPAITAGDVDVDVEDAYFTGDEAPGGDNPTPDQDVVDEIGAALGVEYGDSEELKSSEKLSERDKHRWELDPASAEDYRDREQGKDE